MKSKRDNMFTSVLKKNGGKLSYTSKGDEAVYKLFLDSLEEGQTVEIFLDANKDDGTLAQLAKIHKCIREIAKETGDNYEDMKLLIKKRAGLCFKKEVDGETFLYCKSFADASRSDLGLVIETIISIGDLVGVNVR